MWAAVGQDIATPSYFSDLGYCEDDLSAEATLIGTCWDGSSRAKVYQPAVCGGYHISGQTAEQWQEDEPDVFEPV
jgi:hypothetical protein